MSRRRVLAVLTAAVVLLPGLAHAGSPAPAGRVSVVYEHPEQFTDVKDTAAGLTRGRDAYLAALAGWLERRAARRVPADHALAIAITDVDRAGTSSPRAGRASRASASSASSMRRASPSGSPSPTARARSCGRASAPWAIPCS
jgi:hypothetical protein